MKHLKKFNQTIPVKVNKYVYHTSSPKFRDSIKSQGLITKGPGENWLSTTKINLMKLFQKQKCIFASNSDNKEDQFKWDYDDDIWRIDTELIPNNEWFRDPNSIDDKWVITFQDIPVEAIELIHEGTGESKY